MESLTENLSGMDDHNYPQGGILRKEMDNGEEIADLACSETASLSCKVCGGKASGIHYGIAACHGCRSFFRRAVVKQRKYICHYDGKCIISVKDRLQCQACRYKKSLDVGMKPEYAMNKKSNSEGKDLNPSVTIDDSTILRSTLTLGTLNLVESFYFGQNSSKCIQVPFVDVNTIRTDLPTYVIGLHKAWQAEVMAFVNWSKRIPGFRDLDIEDQVQLLRAASRKHLFLWSAFQTARTPKGDIPYLLMKNVKAPVICADVDFYGDRMGNDIEDWMVRFDNEVVKRLRTSQITAKEIVCFETLLLLNPNVRGLANPSKVRMLRREIQTLILNEGAVDKVFLHRIMEFHLLLPVIDKISLSIVREAHIYKFFRILENVAKLLEDLLFHKNSIATECDNAVVVPMCNADSN